MTRRDDELRRAIDARDLYGLTADFSPQELARALAFGEALRLARALLYNDDWNEALQEYSFELLEAVRALHPAEWNSDWRHDAFLGQTADVALRYEARYAAFRRAFEAAETPSAELRVSLARCIFAPGGAPISEDEAIGLLEQALAERPLARAAEMLEGIYRLRGDRELQARWRQRRIELEATGLEERPLEPPKAFKRS